MTVHFISNTARTKKRAIYSENSDQLLSFFSYTCLFRPVENKPRDVHFDFINNTAGNGYGNAIYMISLHACGSCCEAFNESYDPFNAANECLRNFSFNYGRRKLYDANTDIAVFYFSRPLIILIQHYTLKVIPEHLYSS